MDDAEVLSYLSSGRRRTIDNIAKHMKSEKHKLHEIVAGNSNINQGSMKDITPSTSLKKHDRGKMMKYLWKDIKAENITSLDQTLSSNIIHLSEIDPEGSLLHFATKSQMKSVVEVLLKHNSPTCCNESSSGLAPIHIAAKLGSITLISVMLDYNIPLDMVTLYEKRTLLHIAVQNRRGDTLKFLLDKKVDPNATDIYGTTPLNLAVCLGYEDIAITLLESGADINLSDKEGWAPLHSAVTSCQPHIVKMLTHYKAIISNQTKYGKTPLHLACMKNNFELVNILIDNDATIDIKDSHGKTPADYTTNRSIVTILKDSCQPPEHEDKKHINMQIRSKSLIDLLDEDYLEDHYYSHSDENQNLNSASLEHLFKDGDRKKKISLASLVRGIVNSKQKKEHTVVAQCNSIDSRVSDSIHIGKLETIGEGSEEEEEKSLVSQDSALDEVEYEHSMKDDTSEHEDSGHSDVHTDKLLDANKTDVSDYLKLHNTRIRKIAMATSTPMKWQENDSSVAQDMMTSTFDHVNRCLTSISEVKQALDVIKNNEEEEDKHEKVEKLKEYMQKWLESTVTFKINFKTKFGDGS